MTSQHIMLRGRYYNGVHPAALPAVIEFAGHEATLETTNHAEHYQIDKMSVSPRSGQADRFITLPDGGQFQCPDHAVLNALPQESPSEGPVAWLEERWGIALACVAIIAVLLLFGYFYGLPAAANTMAYRIPMSTEQALGSQAVDWLDKNNLFKPSQLDRERQNKIREGFDILRSDLPLKDYYRLEFRDSTFMGPNAFALPGGSIVISDDLVNLGESQEEILAVLAHEMGHVELRHTLRSVLQNSAVAVVAATVTSDAASLSVAVAGLPILLAQTKYSREFETEADEFAFELLRRRNYSPAAFASIMERLSETLKEKKHGYSFISTHPVTEERIKKARSAADK